MIELTREVRFGVHPEPPNTPSQNGFAGNPPLAGLGVFLTLQATVRGPVDQRTGMLVNIKQIDAQVRAVAVPRIRAYAAASGSTVRGGGDLLPELLQMLAAHLPQVELVALELGLSPYLALRVMAKEPTMVQMAERFEFSAAHRLHSDALSPAENEEIFGRCNNPNGHGHNYELEVTLSGHADPRTGLVMPVPALQQIVNSRVIDVFDHKHLNVDCAEFAKLNPTVENIARVIYEKLSGSIPAPAKLLHVRVWETPKTVAQYGG
jgi:6-pyruvoyltetrahydropterin/6-carboxytetrahydropterin synthase